MRTAPYFAALGFLTIIHAVNVIRLRGKHKVSLGDGGVPELLRAMRIFGNHIEYAPIGLLFILALEFNMAPAWCLHLAGTSLLLGRVLHATALTKNIFQLRVAGMMLTFFSLGFASLCLLVLTYLTSAP